MYFLYLNNTKGALDAVDSLNKEYKLDVDAFCKANLTGDMKGMLPEFNETAKYMLDVRNNMEDTFTVFAQVFILILMTFITLVNTFWMAYSLRPYHIPVFLRGAKTTDWHERFRISNAFFTFTWLLSGCMPSLNFTDYGEKCLAATSD